MNIADTENTLDTLFEQLGLDASEAGQRQFVEEHAPIPSAVLLADAPFWNESQRAFIVEAIAMDAEWAPAVGQLDALLRVEQ